jgi:predicted lipoprotein with Yx(FWY)xxD motif
VTGGKHASRRAWYAWLHGKRAGLTLAAVAAAAIAAVAVIAVTAPGVVFAWATSSAASSAAKSGAPRPSIPANHAYVAPAATSSAELPPGGLVPAHHGQPSPIRPATASTLPSGVPSNVAAGSTPPSLTVEVATSPLYGVVLVTPAGMTLYRQSGTCDCDGRYRPLLTQPGQQLRLPPLLHGQLGSVTRPDGTLQVTFDRWPLYLYTGDQASGDANGVNLAWHVIKPVS